MGRICKYAIRGEARCSKEKVRGLKRAVCKPKRQRSRSPEQTERAAGRGGAWSRYAESEVPGRDTGPMPASGPGSTNRFPAQGLINLLPAPIAKRGLVRVCVSITNRCDQNGRKERRVEGGR